MELTSKTICNGVLMFSDLVVFDNSYSWMRWKHLYYCVEVFTNDEDTEVDMKQYIYTRENQPGNIKTLGHVSAQATRFDSILTDMDEVAVNSQNFAWIKRFKPKQAPISEASGSYLTKSTGTAETVHGKESKNSDSRDSRKTGPGSIDSHKDSRRTDRDCTDSQKDSTDSHKDSQRPDRDSNDSHNDSWRTDRDSTDSHKDSLRTEHYSTDSHKDSCSNDWDSTDSHKALS